MADLDQAMRDRLSAAGVDLSGLFGPGLGPWEAWLRLRDHDGRRATLVDLYELEAASRGCGPKTCPPRTGSDLMPYHFGCAVLACPRRCLAAGEMATRMR